MFYINKSLLTNVLALLISIVGVCISNDYVQSVGFYALSGAITNWLAIYMLFEKIPFVYGSGVVPNKFESFKKAIKNMMLEQFFTKSNFEKFFNNQNINEMIRQKLISKIDYNKVFDGFVDALMDSSYGAMIDMFLGGREGLEKLRNKFIEKIEIVVADILSSVNFQGDSISKLAQDKIENIIDSRLEELTPKMVKDLVQQIIRNHLGWLVVWGGVFGGVIGLFLSCLRSAH